jgi:hypothetical protein
MRSNPRKFGPFPVWPYFFLSAITGVLGSVFLFVWWPSGYPEEADLVRIGGDIASTVVRDDISNTSAGAMLPGITSVYFKLEGLDDEFRYPSTHPNFLLVRDYTAVAIDIRVVAAELGTGAPVTIWQIQERNPHDAASDLTNVSYDEVIERLLAVDRSMVEVGYWLLAACAGFLLIGAAIGRWNRPRS